MKRSVIAFTIIWGATVLAACKSDKPSDPSATASTAEAAKVGASPDVVCSKMEKLDGDPTSAEDKKDCREVLGTIRKQFPAAWSKFSDCVLTAKNEEEGAACEDDLHKIVDMADDPHAKPKEN